MDTAFTAFLLATADHTILNPEKRTLTMQTPLNPTMAVARILIALLYIVAGVVKLIYYTGTLGYFTKIGVPLADVALPLVILIEFGGGIALAIGWQLRFVAPVLAVFTLIAALVGHQFWAADPSQFTTQLYNFLKNLAIIGAFIVLFVADRKSTPRA